MSDRTVVLELAGEHKLARDLVAGGVFVPGYQLPLNEDCELVLRGADASELRIPATVVWSGGGGVGLQLHGCDAGMKQRIAALATPAAEPIELLDPPADPADDPPADPADDPPLDLGIDLAAAETDGTTDEAAADDASGSTTDGVRKPPPNLHERLRGLTMAQQAKMAAHGEAAERQLLERMYGKNVWEALLRNPRLTGPEVARIARMGSLPRPLMEIILNNGGWLQIPEVRRALLSNTRLGIDQVLRILRLLPKHELKLAATQTAYPLQVRDGAKRLLKEQGGG